MNLDQSQELWGAQGVPQNRRQTPRQLVERYVDSTGRQIRYGWLAVAVLLAFGVFNFYGQFVVNGDGLLVCMLRFAAVMLGSVIHLYVLSEMRRKRDERLSAGLDQRRWLAAMVDDLTEEVSAPPWLMLGFVSLLIGLVGLSKWIDYRTGADSAAECVAVMAVVFAVVVGLLMAVQQYRNHFLIPRRRRLQQALVDYDDEV